MLVLVTGCGGAAEPSHSTVRERANAICTDLRRQGAASPAASRAAFIRQQTRVASILEGGATRFRRLAGELNGARAEAPRDYAHSLDRQQRKVRAVVGAARRRDDAALKRLLGTEQTRLNRENDRLARRLGARACLTES